MALGIQLKIGLKIYQFTVNYPMLSKDVFMRERYYEPGQD
jgi:hypothetical protein